MNLSSKRSEHGAFRLRRAAQRLIELKVSTPQQAEALLAAMVHILPDSLDKRDIEYLEERGKEMEAIETSPSKRGC